MSKYSLGRIEAIIAQLQSADDTGREKYLNHLRATEPELLVEVLRFMRDTGDSSLEDLGDRIREAVTPGTALIGRTIKQYTIEEVIGVGGMGVVYKAWDSKLKVYVALKFLPERLRDDEAARERFMHEAQAVARIDHRNICAIYSVEETKEGIPFLSMRLYEGETLRDRLDSGPLSFKDAKDIFSQTAAGLSAAHKEGLIHRDIKPENLFITNSGSVKILDFGIAAATDDSRISTDEGMIGTVAYMSPEQTGGEPDAVTVKSDLWALGAVGYEMVTGRPPFDGEDRQAIIKGILNGEPPELPKKTPKPLARVIRKCLRKDPSRRISSAWHVETFLERTRARPRPTVVMALSVVAALATGLWLGSLLGLIDLSLDKPVLDVVPFASLAGDSVNTEMALGFSDVIRESLGRTEEMVVREGYGGYEDVSTYITEVPRKWDTDVDYVLWVQMSRTTSGVKLHAELYSASDEQAIWDEDYDFPQESYQSVRDKILREVRARLENELEVVSAQSAQSEQEYSDDTVANRHYIRGRGLLKLRTGPGLADAIKEFNEVASRDTEFADAHAARSLALALSQSMAYVIEPDSAKYEEARKIALHALELDPSNYLAHLVLGFVSHNFDWDWEAAERHYQNAYDLNPQNPDVLHFYSTHLAERGYLDRAKEMQLDATIRSPDVPHYFAGYAMHLYLDGEPQKLLDEMATWAERMREFHVSRFWQALALMDEGEFEESEASIHAFEEATLSTHPMALHLRGRWHGLQGHKEAAVGYADLLREKFPTLVASIYQALGDTEAAIDEVERGFEERGTYMTIIGVWPSLEDIRQKQRFQDVLDKMGLPGRSLPE